MDYREAECCEDCDKTCEEPCEILLQYADMQTVGVVIDTEEKYEILMKILGLPVVRKERTSLRG